MAQCPVSSATTGARVSRVRADDDVGEAALLPSSQDFLDGRRRVTGKRHE
jgi:hypothetical protein